MANFHIDKRGRVETRITSNEDGVLRGQRSMEFTRMAVKTEYGELVLDSERTDHRLRI